MLFLLILLLTSCSNYSSLKINYKPINRQQTREEVYNENYLTILIHDFMEKINLSFPSSMDEQNFMINISHFKEEIGEGEFENAIFANWLILNCMNNKMLNKSQIFKFIKEKIDNLDFCKTGYNFLHLSVYLKDPDLFLEYFNEEDIYFTGNKESFKINPLQSLFLLNLLNENTILDFLTKVDSCLNKEIIEKTGAMVLSCRFIMPKVVNYFISKGAESLKELKITNPSVEGNEEIEKKIKDWEITFTPLNVALSSVYINNQIIFDPLEIMFADTIFIFGKDIKFTKWQKNYSKWIPNVYLQIEYALCDVFDKITLDLGVCFHREYESDLKKQFSLLNEQLIENFSFSFQQLIKLKEKIKEENIKYKKFFCFLVGAEYKEKKEKIDKNTAIAISKYTSNMFLDKGAEDNISLESYLGTFFLFNEVEEIDMELCKLQADDFCEYFNKTSINKWNNIECLSYLFKINEKDIIYFIKKGYFGLARLLIRLSEQFKIDKNKIYVRKSNEKNKKNKKIQIKESYFDKIICLREKKEINQEELEETISLARDKGWMTEKEISEIKFFITKKEKEAKRRKLFKELYDLQEAQRENQAKKEEQQKATKEVKCPKLRDEDTKLVDRASLVDFVEAKANYFEMDKEEAFEIFQQLVEEENKEELVVLLNKAEDKIDKNFEVVKAQDEKTRQLLIIRGFKITKKLVLSILDKNQKKAITTLFREITKEIREEIFSFSEEEKKTAITKEMKELMRKYGDVFEVEIEENFIEEKNEERKKREYEIYKISDIDRGSDLYLFDKELNFRTPLALQNMREGRGDAKKISPKEELFEYRMLGHGEEGNLRIYYKLQKNKKIILEVTYKGKDSLSVRKIESLERKANQINLRGIEIILF